MKYTYLTLIIFFIASCKDKDEIIKKPYCEEKPGECLSVLEGKKYFAFNLGSWWVYQEEQSGERDSVYVTESTNSSENYTFDIRTHSTLQDYNYHYWVTYASGAAACNTLNPVEGKCLYVNGNKAKSGDYVGEGICFFVNYKKNDFMYSFNTNYTNNKVITEDILESYVLGDLTFTRTIKMHELSTVIEGNQSTNHYYSNGVERIVKIRFLTVEQGIARVGCHRVARGIVTVISHLEFRMFCVQVLHLGDPFVQGVIDELEPMLVAA